MEERFYWLGFSVFPGIGPKTFQRLIEEFGTAQNAWQAKRSDLGRLIGDKILARFEDFRNTFSLKDYTKKLQEKDVSFVILADKAYPSLLAQIKNPPFVLYIKGKKEILNQVQDDDRKYIGIVGTRKITQYGKQVTEFLTRDLVLAGFTIVSGLAMGVDAVTHRTTIENGGKTIAVLGCGVDCCSPSENFGLYNDIIKSGGAIVSEFPLGQMPTKGSFPSRNRIIAGLSMGVLVTEGAGDSGALITANDAFENNRKVFAVPGPITSSLSEGPYLLLEKGAKLVRKGEDVLREFKMQNAKGKITIQNSKVKDATKEEQEILDLLVNEQLHFNDIVRRIKKPSAEVGGILSFMELKGMVKSLDGGFFGKE